MNYILTRGLDQGGSGAKTGYCTYLESRSGWLPKFNGDLRVQRYVNCKKIFMKIRLVFPHTGAKLWKMPECWRILQNVPRSRSKSGRLPKFNQFFPTHLVKFSWRYDQYFLHKVANRQTDRQTDRQMPCKTTSKAEANILTINHSIFLLSGV